MRKLTFGLILLTISVKSIAQSQIPIDTNYLPVWKFQVGFSDKSWIDTVSVYFYIEHLKAFEEPPIYCCQSDSTIRILTMPSFEPATLITLLKKNSQYFIQTKISNKVGVNNSYVDVNRLNRKDRKRFWELENSKIPRSEWTQDDQRIYYSTIVQDTVKFSYSIQEYEISQNDWKSVFSHLNSKFYKLYVKPVQYSFVADGYFLLIEAVTSNGYIALQGGSTVQTEWIVQELIHKILNLSQSIQTKNR